MRKKNIDRFVTFIGVLIMASGGASAEPKHGDALHIKVGGFLGTTYEVQATGFQLQYCVKPAGKEAQCETLQPDEADWKEFYDELDAIGIWGWQASYSNAQARDGTQWQVQMHRNGQSVAARGSNAFPLEDGSSNVGPYYSNSFKRLLKAVQVLTKRPFE